jgi:hypothetical protein
MSRRLSRNFSKKVQLFHKINETLSSFFFVYQKALVYFSKHQEHTL